MIQGICHAAIAVSDLKRSLEFYCGKLGFTLIRQFTRTDGAELVDLVISPHIDAEVQLVYYASRDGFAPVRQKQLGLEHVALLVDDLDATCQDLEKKGIHPKDPLLASRPPRGARFLDPDGVIVELIESHVPKNQK